MSRNDPGEVKPRKTQLPCGIIKRDGSRVAFEPRRIVAALGAPGSRQASSMMMRPLF
jgi:hypothetical protein